MVCSLLLATTIDVGYASRTAPAGFSLHCPTFVPVQGGDVVKFGDIQLVNAKSDMSELIMILDENGLNPATYMWLYGKWYNLTGYADMTNEPFPAAGRGFYVHMDADTQIQFAGAVKPGELSYTIPAGFSILGNSSNVDLTLGQIELVDAKSDMSELIMVLDENGLNPATYMWLYGKWYNMTGYADMSTEPVKAGEGLYFHMDSSVGVKLPAQL